eukprot:3557558-Amphidinium_carterae.1
MVHQARSPAQQALALLHLATYTLDALEIIALIAASTHMLLILEMQFSALTRLAMPSTPLSHQASSQSMWMAWSPTAASAATQPLPALQ